MQKRRHGRGSLQRNTRMQPRRQASPKSCPSLAARWTYAMRVTATPRPRTCWGQQQTGRPGQCMAGMPPSHRIPEEQRQCMGSRLNTPRSLCREPGGSEPTPGDLQAMLSASAGLGSRAHSTAPGAVLDDDEDEDGEYGPKRPVAPKVHAAHALLLACALPQLPGCLCLSSPRPAPAWSARGWARSGCGSGARARRAARPPPPPMILRRLRSHARCSPRRRAMSWRRSCMTCSATPRTCRPCRSWWSSGGMR